MPQVPQYNGNVQENGIPTDRVPIQSSIESFGGGEGVSGVFKQAQDLVQKGRDAADKVQILDSHAKATELKNRILHGYTNEAGEEVLGALKQQGKNALGLPESTQKEYEDGIQKITENLNPRQQNMFRAASDEIRLSVNDKVRAHVSAESYKVQIQSMKTSVDVNKQDAIANFEDDKQRDIAILNIGASIRAGGKMAGWDNEMIENQIRQEVSGTNKEIVERYLNKGDYAGADQYFKNNYKSFTGEHQSDVDKLVKAGMEDREVYKTHDDIMAVKGISEPAAKAKIKSLYDAGTISAQVRKESTQMIEHTFSQMHQAKAESQSNLNIAAANILDANGGDIKDQKVINIKRGMTTEQRANVDRYAEVVANGGYDSDPYNYDNFEAKLRSNDQAERLSVTPADITNPDNKINRKGTRSQETLLKLLSENKIGSEKTLKERGDWIAEDDLVRQKIADAGIDPKSEEAKLLNSRLKAHIRAAQDLNDGKPLIKAEKIKAIDQLMMEDSFGFFGKYGGPIFRIGGGAYRFTTKVDQIDDITVGRITKYLEAKGQKATDEKVLAVYNSRKSRK